MNPRRLPPAAPIVAAALCLTGCASGPVNPSFNISVADARADLARMRSDARHAPRPIVIIGGYCDPGVVGFAVARSLRACFTDDIRIVSFQPAAILSMDTARERLVDKVQAAFPTDDPAATAEVDVVAVSMGGLVARHAALPRDGQRRLRIATLYTLSSPHRGAQTAVVPTFEPRVADMRAGSEFLTRLDAAPRDYAIVPYGRLGDFIVGVENTAPPGQIIRWVPTPALQTAHIQVYSDERILADIVRRMRGEKPFSTDPAAPLPSS